MLFVRPDKHCTMIQVAQVRVKRPRITTELIPRPRLIGALDAGLGVPVTFISASAGFGKTTLLLDWLESVSLPVAWMSLEESDDSPDVFTTYLVTAIRSIFPRALGSILGLLESPAALEPTRLAAALSNALAELPEEFILVLDDYHMVGSPGVQALMSELVKQVPPSMHLVISARYDIPLPLAKLRANGQIVELRNADLRFTTDEMNALLERIVKGELAPEILQWLDRAVEGWVMGIRFAALTLRAGAEASELLDSSIKLSNRQMTDYFLNEIFLRQPPETQEFLLKTSILERFTRDECDALRGNGPGENWRAILEQLVRDELMVIALDENEGWYRYHQLFRDFLRSRMAVTFDAKTITKLNRRASEWNAAHGFISEAIQYSIAAGDFARGADLVGVAVGPLLDTETARPYLESWLRLFPKQEWDRHLGLVMAQLWLAQLQFRLPVMKNLQPLARQRLDEARDLGPTERNRYLAEIEQFNLGVAFFTNQADLILQSAPHALENLAPQSVYARGNLLVYRAVSLQMTGSSADGIRLLTDTYSNYAGDSIHFRLRMLLGLALIYLYEADYCPLFDTATRMVELARDQSYVTLGWAHNFLGLVHYEWNQLEAAAQHFSVGSELRFSSNTKPAHESFAWLALTEQAQGYTETAADTLQEVLRFSDEMRSPDLANSTEAYRARLATIRGDTVAALRWADSASLPQLPHMLYDAERNLTRLRALIASRKRERVQTALTETNALLEASLGMHNTRRTIQLYALKALALDALGQTNRALDALEASIQPAAWGGFKRTWLDLGPGMAHMLSLLQARKVAPDYINSILAAIPRSTKDLAPVPTTETASGRVIEPLTWREIQVLKGLADHLSTKEIAQALVISPLTVKSHIGHIFTKLDVNSRDEAVRVAAAYGLLETGRGEAPP